MLFRNVCLAVALVAALAAEPAAAQGAAQGGDAFVPLRPEDIRFGGPAPDPSRREVHATGVPQERTVLVLSGTLHFGFGDEWDDSKLQAFPPGTFFNEPHAMPHFAGTRDEEVVTMVTGIGPTGVIPVQPAR